jgi:predicted HTH transcriptional regulator
MPTHAKRKDVDEAELETYSKLIGKSKDNILESVTSANGFLTVRGVVVLVAKPEEHLEGEFIEIQRYDNFMGSPPTPIGSAVKISKPARQMIEDTTRIIEQILPVSRTYEGARMTQEPAIPVSIIREMITNAVAHRNYRSHEHICVRIYADGFDVNNPAVVTEKMWADIQAHQATYHPNEGIYTFLSPAKLYEGRGEGIWKIRAEMERLGKTAPEFKVIGDAPSTFYARVSLTPARAKDVKLQRLEALLSKKKEITTTDVMKHLKVSRVTAINLLKRMVEQGRLEHQGSTRTSRYTVKVQAPSH